MFILAFRPKFDELKDVVGGDQIRPYELFSNLAKLGHRVHIYEFETPLAAPREYFDGNLRVYTIGQLPLPLLLLKMRKILCEQATWAKENGYEAPLYYHQVPIAVLFRLRFIPLISQPGILLFDFAKRLGFRIWAIVHDLSPDHELEQKKRISNSAHQRMIGIKSKIHSWLQKRYLPKADFISAVSPPIIDALVERYQIERSRASVFQSGYNPSLLEPVGEWKVPDKNSTWRIGYLGSPGDVSLDLIIKSVKELGRENVQLVLAGRSMSEMVSHLRNLWPNIEVIDGIRYENYAKIANQVDLWVIVFNDAYCINFSWQLKNPMALASGRPVVRTDGLGMQTSGLAQHFFLTGSEPAEIASAIAKVMDNTIETELKVLEARRVARKNFSWEEIAKKLISDIEKTDHPLEGMNSNGREVPDQNPAPRPL